MAARRTRRWGWAIGLAVIAVLAFRCGCGGAGAPVRVATFNIESFPKSERQVAGAFETIRGLGAAAVAVQEITDGARFDREARARLGPSWRFVHASGEQLHNVGILFDEGVLELLSTRTYREVGIDRGGRPAFEARLRPDEGEVLRLIVVHLRSGSDGFDTRRRQLRRLRPIVRGAVASGDRVALLGDFNATGDPDRRLLRRLARATESHWASEPLECTSYWRRRDGCLGTPLDHVLTSEPVLSIAARGPCETDGCGQLDRCPLFHEEVSDHCPVVVEIP